MPIYFLTFHTKPTLANEQVNKIEGAYINCWIDADDIETAEKTAAQKIQDTNWEILNTEDGYEITREDYPSRNKGLECYEQALVDKEVYLTRVYPDKEDE